jgi:hypothetical protein
MSLTMPRLMESVILHYVLPMQISIAIIVQIHRLYHSDHRTWCKIYLENEPDFL